MSLLLSACVVCLGRWSFPRRVCVVFCAEAFGVCTPGCKKKKVVKKPRGARKDDGLTRRKSIAVFQVRRMRWLFALKRC